MTSISYLKNKQCLEGALTMQEGGREVTATKCQAYGKEVTKRK